MQRPRSRIPALAAAALLASACSTVGRGGAPSSCIIYGGIGGPAVARIYDADPYARPGGHRLFIGLLNYGEQHRIVTHTGKIWFAWARDGGDTWFTGYESACRDGNRVEIPPP